MATGRSGSSFVAHNNVMLGRSLINFEFVPFWRARWSRKMEIVLQLKLLLWFWGNYDGSDNKKKGCFEWLFKWTYDTTSFSAPSCCLALICTHIARPSLLQLAGSQKTSIDVSELHQLNLFVLSKTSSVRKVVLLQQLPFVLPTFCASLERRIQILIRNSDEWVGSQKSHASKPNRHSLFMAQAMKATTPFSSLPNCVKLSLLLTSELFFGTIRKSDRNQSIQFPETQKKL